MRFVDPDARVQAWHGDLGAEEARARVVDQPDLAAAGGEELNLRALHRIAADSGAGPAEHLRCGTVPADGPGRRGRANDETGVDPTQREAARRGGGGDHGELLASAAA